MNRFFRNTGFYLLIVLVTVGIVNFIANKDTKTLQIPYHEFRQALVAGNVERVSVQPDRGVYLIEGTFKQPPAERPSKQFYTYGPLYTDEVPRLVAQSGIPVEYREQKGDSVWLTFLR